MTPGGPAELALRRALLRPERLAGPARPEVVASTPGTARAMSGGTGRAAQW